MATVGVKPDSALADVGARDAALLSELDRAAAGVAITGSDAVRR
jgi:hypothetical protein